jgi:hypothetical protein
MGSGGSGGSTSPGKATVEFAVQGGPYCMTSSCGDGPSIDIEEVNLAHSCSDFSCRTCQPSFGAGCGAIQCPQPQGIAVTGAKMVWDGSYFAGSTCTLQQSQVSCSDPAFAAPGKYTAKFCATPGTLTGPDGGPRQCVASGAMKCATVQFDYPSTTTVTATLGP